LRLRILWVSLGGNDIMVVGGLDSPIYARFPVESVCWGVQMCVWEGVGSFDLRWLQTNISLIRNTLTPYAGVS
jgi:hypothetical protein